MRSFILVPRIQDDATPTVIPLSEHLEMFETHSNG
jgi:hypothetical protein